MIHAWIILPEHLHCLIDLLPNDADFAMSWRLIKMRFSKSIPPKEKCLKVRHKRGGQGIWQQRYLENLIRDEADYCAQMNCMHFNPVKHGLASRVSDWPYSTFNRLVKQDFYTPELAGGTENLLTYDD